jgi:5-methyltetrahydrofolate--homocysteine methyltransferase
VLACNNYEIIDLGVMVAADKILNTAIEKDVDVIGLSGLITPSLDEMVHVAKEMTRRGMEIPLMIGGATTSEIHTAVKIEPNYAHGVIHVKDASKSVGVVSALLSAEQKPGFLKDLQEKYRKDREKHAADRSESEFIPLSRARENKLVTDWGKENIKVPSSLGITVFGDYSLEEISRFIDWTFFFHAWRIPGKFPAIFSDPVKGVEARKLYDDAQVLLAEMINKKMVQAKGIIGLFPANSDGDDILVYEDEKRDTVLSRFHFLRNQQQKEVGHPNLCLSDFVAPVSSGIPDYFGSFVVTSGHGLEPWVKYYEEKLDDYTVIMLKILSDRLAEAFAELLHSRVRKEFWGYSKGESLDLPAILREEYQGIRPAPGYPACPEHSEKQILFDMLHAGEHTGVTLTESYAMWPPSSVSGLYFAHPLSQYFNVGRISRDQVEDYAARKGVSIDQAEKWLGQNLNYK